MRSAKWSGRRAAPTPVCRLHAYVLSVTPAAQVDAGARSAADWKRDGVYFLNERDCLQEVIAHALRRSPVPAALSE